jgi:hypothetical protein
LLRIFVFGDPWSISGVFADTSSGGLGIGTEGSLTGENSLEERTESGEGCGCESDGGFDEGPFYEVDSFPGVVGRDAEFVDVVDADKGCGARTATV